MDKQQVILEGIVTLRHNDWATAYFIYSNAFQFLLPF